MIIQFMLTKYSKMILRSVCVLIVFSILIIVGCKRTPEQKEPLVPRPEISGVVIADTVIYDVIVKNPDAGDVWKDEALSKLDREGLVDEIFEAVYRRELIPFDYISNEVLSVRDIRELENDPEFSRKNIGMIQFSEEWYFDRDNLRMEKRVNSLSLGYEVFDLSGNLRGYRPAFTVKLN